MANETPRYIRDKQAAEILGVSAQHLRNMRCKGEGPPTVKMGRWAVRYPVSGLIEWAEAGRVSPIR